MTLDPGDSWAGSTISLWRFDSSEISRLVEVHSNSEADQLCNSSLAQAPVEWFPSQSREYDIERKIWGSTITANYTDEKESFPMW